MSPCGQSFVHVPTGRARVASYACVTTAASFSNFQRLGRRNLTCQVVRIAILTMNVVVGKATVWVPEELVAESGYLRRFPLDSDEQAVLPPQISAESFQLWLTRDNLGSMSVEEPVAALQVRPLCI